MNQARHAIVVLLLGSALLAAGCRSTKVQPWDEYADTITHAGTIADLNRGQYAGFMAVSNVLRYGDFGLGTFDGLDGEMILYSGQVFRADTDLKPALVDSSVTTPFAVVSFFAADRMFDVERMDQKLFERALAMRRKNDLLPQAVQVHGVFSHLEIRSVPRQETPWRPLAEVVATDSVKQAFTNIAGRMVGYYMPAPFGGIHPEGFHFHFISDDRSVGGHVLGFAIAQARIEVDSSPRIQVLVNTNAPVFNALPR